MDLGKLQRTEPPGANEPWLRGNVGSTALIKAQALTVGAGAQPTNLAKVNWPDEKGCAIDVTISPAAFNSLHKIVLARVKFGTGGAQTAAVGFDVGFGCTITVPGSSVDVDVFVLSSAPATCPPLSVSAIVNLNTGKGGVQPRLFSLLGGLSAAGAAGDAIAFRFDGNIGNPAGPPLSLPMPAPGFAGTFIRDIEVFSTNPQDTFNLLFRDPAGNTLYSAVKTPGNQAPRMPVSSRTPDVLIQNRDPVNEIVNLMVVAYLGL